MAAFLLLACEPEVKVGSFSCPWPQRLAEGDDPTTLTPVTDPVPVPWATSFEQGQCDYNRAQGFCYHRLNSSFEVVEGPAPVHSGHKAMAFTIAAAAEDGQQTRCVLEGIMPAHAVYSAFFYVPSGTTPAVNWNLMYFVDTWDVSIGRRDSKDSLRLYVREHFTAGQVATFSTKTLPTNRWVKIELRLLRSTDAVGEVELRQDGETVVVLKQTKTEKASTRLGQWYVGNLATDDLNPPDSTIYVDDVSVRLAP